MCQNMKYRKKMGIVGQGAYTTSLNKVVRVRLTIVVTFEQRLKGKRRHCIYLG